MGNVHLLDCTLRDGGYLNDWKFGKDNIASIYERLSSRSVFWMTAAPLTPSVPSCLPPTVWKRSTAIWTAATR